MFVLDKILFEVYNFIGNLFITFFDRNNLKQEWKILHSFFLLKYHCLITTVWSSSFNSSTNLVRFQGHSWSEYAMECSYLLEYRLQNYRLWQEESHCKTLHHKKVMGQRIKKMRPSSQSWTRTLLDWSIVCAVILATGG